MTYQNGAVSVDQHFARFGEKSYAINKITSVDVQEERKSGCGFVVASFIAFSFTIAGMGMLAWSRPGGWVAAAFAIAFDLFVWITWRGRRSRRYHLLLSTAAGEVQASSSYDRDEILQLRAAIEAEIARH